MKPKTIPILSTAGLAGLLLVQAAVASPAVAAEPENPTDVVCETPINSVSYTTTSYLKPGEGNVTRDEKNLDFNDDGVDEVDIAIDGWAGGVGVDGWSGDGMANFRVVVGTLYDLTDVSTTFTITAADGSQLSAEAQVNDPSAPVSPAGGATPERYKAVALTEFAPLVVQDGRQSIDWTVTPDATMPAAVVGETGSSAHYQLQVPASLLESLGAEPVAATLTLSADIDGLTEPVACPDEDGDGYTDYNDGDNSTCEAIDWTASSTTDGRLIDYSNNGYRSKVSPEFGSAGYLSIHHWSSVDGDTLFWRVPIGTEYPLTAGSTMTFTVGENWTVNEDSFSTLAGDLFERFTGVPGFEENAVTGEPTYSVDGKTITVTLPEMPAASNVMFTFNGTVDGSSDPLATGFALDGVLTGTYPESVSEQLGCNETTEPTDPTEPTEPSEPSEPTEPTDPSEPTDTTDDELPETGMELGIIALLLATGLVVAGGLLLRSRARA